MIADAITYPTRGDNVAAAVVRGGGISLVASLLGTLAALLLVGTFVVELLELAYGAAFLGWLTQYSAVAVLVGTALAIGAVLVQMTVTGYYVRVVRSTTDGHAELPPFDRLTHAFIDGTVTTAMLAAYFLPVLLVVGVAFALGVVDVEALASAGSLVTLAVVLVVLVVTFLFPATLTNYAATGSIRSGFAADVITDFAFSREYLVAWVAGLAIWGAGLTVASLLGGVIPVVGTVFTPFVGFVAGLPAYRLLGLAYTERRSA